MNAFLNFIKNIKLILEALSGDPERGSISIDDVTFKDGSCDIDICDFETDLCGFVNDDLAEFKWIRNSGPTGSFDAGY